MVVGLTGLLLNTTLTYLTVNLLGYPYGTAIALVVFIVPLVSYALNHNWVFQTAK